MEATMPSGLRPAVVAGAAVVAVVGLACRWLTWLTDGEVSLRLVDGPGKLGDAVISGVVPVLVIVAVVAARESADVTVLVVAAAAFSAAEYPGAVAWAFELRSEAGRQIGAADLAITFGPGVAVGLVLAIAAVLLTAITALALTRVRPSRSPITVGITAMGLTGASVAVLARLFSLDDQSLWDLPGRAAVGLVISTAVLFVLAASGFAARSMIGLGVALMVCILDVAGEVSWMVSLSGSDLPGWSVVATLGLVVAVGAALCGLLAPMKRRLGPAANARRR